SGRSPAAGWRGRRARRLLGYDPKYPTLRAQHVQLSRRVLSEAGNGAAGGKGGPLLAVHCLPILESEAPPPPLAVVGVKIMPLQGGNGSAAIDEATGDGAAVVTSVLD